MSDKRMKKLEDKLAEMFFLPENNQSGLCNFEMQLLLDALDTELDTGRQALLDGFTAMEDGKFRKAINYFLVAVSYYKKNVKEEKSLAFAYFSLARAYKSKSYLSKALNTIKKAIRLLPDEPGGYFEHSEISKKIGDLESAKAMIEKYEAKRTEIRKTVFNEVF